jgi:hypothetical protein
MVAFAAAADDATVIALRPGDIFSKWGFGDGDVFDDLLAGWTSERFGGVEDDCARLYFDRHRLLWHAYHRFVARPGFEPVRFVRTVHNPVRAVCEWDGSERTCAEPDEDAPPALIPVREIVSLCEELFPPRPQWWLTLDEALRPATWVRDEPERFGLSSDLFDENDPTSGLTDAVIERFSLTPDSALLVASLLTGGRNGLWSPFDGIRLADAVATARAALDEAVSPPVERQS